MRNKENGEEGMALLVVMILMGVMLTAGVAIASTVNTQTSASRSERVRDSAFNLAESALNAQVFRMTGNNWPGLGRSATPFAPCTSASTGATCPDNASLLAGGSPDLAGASWQTSVRDNSTSNPTFYSDGTTASALGYDSNGDGRVWVRAQATAEGHTRTLVGLVKAETQEEDIPHAALLAGSLNNSNNGNKELLKSNGGLVAVRCNPSSPQYASVACDGQPLGKKHDLVATQVTGTTPVVNYVGPPALTVEARANLKATAQANLTYYTSCPPDSQLTGAVVYIDTAAECRYTGNSQFNSAKAPGVLVLEKGSLYLGGTTNFYGVIYAANTLGLQTTLVQTQGNSQVFGGVLIDGGASMELGSSGLNLEYDVNAFRAVASYGSAGVVQNSFREIKPG